MMGGLETTCGTGVVGPPDVVWKMGGGATCAARDWGWWSDMGGSDGSDGSSTGWDE
jgi:hypothetical protein